MSSPTVIRLMDITSLRIGNIEYAATNDSFGLTTLRNHHVAVRGSTIRLAFPGKSAHDFDVASTTLGSPGSFAAAKTYPANNCSSTGQKAARSTGSAPAMSTAT